MIKTHKKRTFNLSDEFHEKMKAHVKKLGADGIAFMPKHKGYRLFFNSKTKYDNILKANLKSFGKHGYSRSSKQWFIDIYV